MMTITLAQIIASRAERLRMMHDHFKQPDDDVYLNAVVAVLAIFAIFGVMKLLDHLQRRRQSPRIKVQPMALYLRVQAQMGLSLLDRWRLWRLARACGAANPTALLISPALFDRAMEKYTGGIIGSTQAVRLAAIRKRLFSHAEPLPIDPISPAD